MIGTACCDSERVTLRGGGWVYVTYAKAGCRFERHRIGTARNGHVIVPAEAAPADVTRALTQHNIGERTHASH